MIHEERGECGGDRFVMSKPLLHLCLAGALTVNEHFQIALIEPLYYKKYIYFKI